MTILYEIVGLTPSSIYVSFRLIEAIGEVNAKKITIISLRDQLCSAEALLIKFKNRESYYKYQLENGSREFKRLKLEKEQAQGKLKISSEGYLNQSMLLMTTTTNKWLDE